LIRAAVALLFVVAGQVCGSSAALGRPVLDWRSWYTGSSLSESGPTADLLGTALSREAETVDVGVGHRLVLQGDFGLLLRQRRSSREQEVRRGVGGLSWTWRRDSAWLGARLRRESTLLRLRNVHTSDDFLVADRLTESWRIGAGVEHGPWRLQAAAGRSRAGEYSGSVSRKLAGTCLHFGAQLDRNEWVADQSFSQRRYLFRFPLRRETWALTCVPPGDRWPRFRAWREILASEEDRSTGDYNLLYRSGHGAELSWKPGTRGAGVEAAWFSGDMNLKMLADETVYLDLEGARTRTIRAAVSTPAGPWGLRLTGGREQIRLAADEGSFAPWPFLFWDVFEPDRLVLDEFDYRLSVNWLGVARRFEFGPTGPAKQDSPAAVSLDLALSHGWVSGGGDAQWRERVWILWPFVFDYDPQQENVPGLERNLVRLQGEGAWRINSQWRLAGHIQQLIPLILESEQNESVESPVTAPETGYTYGGLSLHLRLEWRGH
jgi:hypothetical protein